MEKDYRGNKQGVKFGVVHAYEWVQQTLDSAVASFPVLAVS